MEPTWLRLRSAPEQRHAYLLRGSVIKAIRAFFDGRRRDFVGRPAGQKPGFGRHDSLRRGGNFAQTLARRGDRDAIVRARLRREPARREWWLHDVNQQKPRAEPPRQVSSRFGVTRGRAALID